VNHWLLKNEPPYSLAALKALPSQTEPWVGVRSHEACNIMRYGFRPGQRVLYYNASIPNPHVAGVAVVAADAEAKPDPTAWDSSSPYFDPRTDPKAPTWFLREVRYEKEFVRPVYLAELRLHSGEGGALHDCSLFRKLRLSIHPLSDAHFRFIEGLQHTPLPEEVKLKPERSKSEGGAAAPAPHPSRNRKNKKTKEASSGTAAAAAPAAAAAEDEEQDVDGADGSAAVVKEPSSRRPSLNRATTAPATLIADASDSSRAAKRQRRQKD
jgi:predicted RNA-binding protein with PUA-like domain